MKKYLQKVLNICLLTIVAITPAIAQKSPCDEVFSREDLQQYLQENLATVVPRLRKKAFLNNKNWRHPVLLDTRLANLAKSNFVKNLDGGVKSFIKNTVTRNLNNLLIQYGFDFEIFAHLDKKLFVLGKDDHIL